jgi:hypothetical protein
MPASCSERTCAFFARFLARVQSPPFAASRVSVINPRTFDAMSACTAFNVFPRVDSRFFSAALMLVFTCCCAFAFSSAESWGASRGISGLSVSTSAEGEDAARGRGGATRTVASFKGGGNSNRSSGAGSVVSEVDCGADGGTVGFTSTAVLHETLGFFCTLHPLVKTAAQLSNTKPLRINGQVKTAWDLTVFSVIFRPRVAVRYGTSCLARPPK